jgi:hypothetical protein
VSRADHASSRGPIPKWCSATCRHRAWEQKRAVSSGRAAVEVVERVVVTPAGTPTETTPRHGEWIPVLNELSRQLDLGLLYNRDLPGLTRALDDVLAAVRRCLHRN